MKNEYYWYLGRRWIPVRGLHTLVPFHGEYFQESCKSYAIDPMHFTSTIEENNIFLLSDLTDDAELATRRNHRGRVIDKPIPCVNKEGERYGSVNINCKELFPDMLMNDSDKALGFAVTPSKVIESTRQYFEANPISESSEVVQMPLFDDILDEVPLTTSENSTIFETASIDSSLQEVMNRLKTKEEELTKLKKFCIDSVPQKYHTMEFYNLLAKDEIVKIFNPDVG